ncbi:ABC transporter thiamine pyrophosphate-binding lipoprotein p37/Cypl [Mycoplasmopsis hyopharyngis]|uniref:ABC transporter thiamine pyrophosphate-binding lipoprotein p37/Cypl n=1 Tax=Mycoplasmopsis hyopharyngis TaxID=29558 RepID=UPI00387347AF
MFLKNKKMLLFSTTLILGCLPIFSSSKCFFTKNANEIKTIKIGFDGGNGGWDEKGQKEFLTILENKWKNLVSKEDKYSKINPNVKFEFRVYNDKVLFTDLVSNKKQNVDIGFLPYSSFAYKFNTREKFENLPLHFLCQTETFRFIWDKEKTDVQYIDGTISDPLRKLATEQNKVYFESGFGEFKNWTIDNPALKWDGGKYSVFYNTKDTTDTYKGVILISGTDSQLEQIVKAWEEKKWEKFINFGIVHGSNTSGSKYKYQVNLLSKHFNKPIKEIVEFLEDSNDKRHIKGKAKELLGISKDLDGKNIVAKNIAFESEGVFNWTKNPQMNYFNPTEQEAKIRVLTTTAVAPYSVLLGRSKMEELEKNILQDIFASLSFKENTLGLYTGWNKFKSGGKEEFWKYIQMQNFIENN